MSKSRSVFLSFAAAAALLAGAAQAFAGNLKIESWRNDDADVWNGKIIPAFNAKFPNIKVEFAPTAPKEYNASALAPGAAVTLGVRPEHLAVQAQAGQPADFTVTATIDHVERLGEISYLHAARTQGAALIAEHRGRGTPLPGDVVRLGAQRAKVHVFDAGGGRVAIQEAP